MSFIIARSIEDALDALSGGARPIAGGSDLVVGARHGSRPLPEQLVAIDRIRDLGRIEDGTEHCRIGASVTHAQLMEDASVVSNYTVLADSSALVGSPATRHVGTLGGNIMNASPAMDTGAPLVVLGAQVELRSVRGTRRVAAGDIWTGPGQTVAADDELCVAVELPHRQPHSGSAYVRLEYRRAMEIAVAGAAASVVLADDGTVAAIDVALSAVAPTIVRVENLDSLVGASADDALLAAVMTEASEQAQPISDLRASEAYRRHSVGVMAKRAVDAAIRRANGETIAVPVNRALGIGVSS